MQEKSINIGKISERQLVEKFATESQKKEYQNNGYKIKGSLKTRILERALRYCKIKDLGKGYYDIRYVYDYPMPSNINKMQNDIYKDLIPLILNKLLSSDKHYNFTIGVWARELKMVNQNYGLIKNKKLRATKIINQNILNIEDFYVHADPCLDNYVTNAFKYLEASGYIKYQKVHMVKERYINNVDQEDDNIVIDLETNTHTATEEEMKFYAQCIKNADLKNDIQSPTERYYGKKSSGWKKDLYKELNQNNILCIYETYQAYVIHEDKCKYLLKKIYGGLSTNTYSNRLVSSFINLLIDNAEKRVTNSEEYKKLFEYMCDLTISTNPNKEVTKELNSLKQKLNIEVNEKVINK